MKENMALQLEATYRKNVQSVATELQRRLNYLKETEEAKERFERDIMLKWIVSGVSFCLCAVILVMQVIFINTTGSLFVLVTVTVVSHSLDVQLPCFSVCPNFGSFFSKARILIVQFKHLKPSYNDCAFELYR